MSEKPDYHKALAEALYALRARQGLTQTDVARPLGWPQNRVGRYESGAREPIPFVDAVQLASRLGYTPNQLAAEIGLLPEPVALSGFPPAAHRIATRAAALTPQEQVELWYLLQELTTAYIGCKQPAERRAAAYARVRRARTLGRQQSPAALSLWAGGGVLAPMRPRAHPDRLARRDRRRDAP